MSSVRPESNNVHTLGTSTYKWATVHSVDVQAATITTSGDVEIGGNLTVSGTQTVLDVTTVSVEDPLLQLAKSNSADSVDIGFYGQIVDGVTTEYLGLYRDASDGKFKLFDSATAAPTTTVSGGSTATLVANLEGAVTGNASTATSAAALTTARSISLGGDLGGSVSFDGSADVTITSTIQAGSVENSMLDNSSITFTDGSNSEALALGATLEIGGTSNEVEVAYSTANNKFTVGLPDDVNIAGDLVVSGTISGTVSANSATATQLATARNISLGGDLGGSASFDGSADVTITATIQAGSVENSMLASDGFSLKLGGITQEDINLGDDLNFAGTTNEVEIAYDSGSNSLTFGLPNTIAAALTGNASTASAWQNARTISLGGDLGGSVSIDGSADATLTATIQSGSVENSMLDNSIITVGDGSTTSQVALGGTLDIVGTANEVTVAHSSGVTTVGLPSSISGLTAISAGDFVGDLTGNADSATALATARAISVSGDATGTVNFDGSANADIALTIAAGAVDNAMLANDGFSLKLGGVAQEDLNLGGNLDFVAGQDLDIAYNTTSNALTFSLESEIDSDTTGNAATASALETARTIALSGDVTGSGSFDGSGDLTISATLAGGTALTFSDGSNSEALALGSTLEIGGTANEVEVAYDSAANKFTVGLPSTISAELSGNASTATALATARTIALSGDVTGSGSFDGSGNLTIASTLAGGTALTFTDGSNSEALALGSTLEVGGTAGEVEVAYSTAANKFTVGLPDDVNIAGDLVVSGTISGTVNANSATATALATARTISLGGDLSGSASFDGSADVTITSTIAAGAVDNAMLANDGFSLKLGGVAQEDINLGDDLDFIAGQDLDIAYNASTNALSFSLEAEIDSDTTGNAATASALETARAISISGDATGSVNFDGSAAADIALTIAAGAVDNAMLANDGFSLLVNGSTQEDINLGDSLDFNGTANQVNVAYSAGANDLTFSLPSSINVDTTGNAATASELATARAISVSGDATGTVNFDGSADADIALTIAAGAVENSMLASDGFSLLVDSVSQEDINLGDSLNFISGQDLDIAYNSTTNQLSFALESEIDSDTTGNAATASAWANSRTISLGGDLSGSVAVNGSADATLTATIAAGSVENAMMVNSQITLAADSGSNDPVALGETLTISGTSNEIETAAAGSNQITIGLPNNVSVSNNLTVANDMTVTSGDLELTDGTLSILGGGASISGTVTINGTHTINGSLIANSATMKFEDSLLELGYTNSSVVDHGFFSKHSDGEYVGNAYDQSASEFIFFKTDTKPTTTVDTGAGGFAYADARLKSLVASDSVQAGGSLINNSAKSAFNKLSFASVSGTATTLSGSQLVGGAILRDATNDETDATATAAQIVAAMPVDARVADMTFEFKIIVSNSSAGYSFTAGSGITIVGSSSYLVDGVHNYLARVTNAGSGSEAVSIYKA